jgi:hypothetical protein
MGLALARWLAGNFGRVYRPKLAAESPSSGGHRARATPYTTVILRGKSTMHRADLLKPDLLSEIVLLGSGAVIVVAVLLILVTALTRA